MEGKMTAIPCSEVKLKGNKEKKERLFLFWVGFWGGGVGWGCHPSISNSFPFRPFLNSQM